MKRRLDSLFRHHDKFFSVGDSALLSLSRLGFTVLLARLLDTEAFALCLLLFTSGVIVLTVGQSWFTTPLIHLAGNGLKIRKHVYVRAQRRLWLLMVGVGILGVFAYSFHFHRSVHGFTFLVFLTSLITGLQVQHERACKQVEFQNVSVFIGDALGLGIHVAVCIVGWFAFQSVLFSFWLGMTLNAGVASYWMQQCSKENELDPQAADGNGNEMTAEMNLRFQRMGNMMLLGSLATTVSSRLHPFLLASVSNPLSVAQFGVVMTLVGPIRMLSVALNVLLRPRLSRYHELNDTHRFKRLVGISIVTLFAGGSLAVGVTLFIENSLIEFIFGQKWELVAGLLPLAVVYATVDAITTCLMVALQSGHRQGAKHTTIARICAAVVTLFSVVPLCLSLGAYGAMISLLAAEFVYLVYASIAIVSCLGRFSFDSLMLRRLLKSCVSCASTNSFHLPMP